ncbi:DUF1778 domain-containing protein [Halomonas sp. OfavH-34-E]|uniref:type II toxin-antitoxin system TacA family antitoxin n=1 Tax=Halomonas sp. OfavH-34-E TaxID=2954491 RepID=UPI002097A04A|nr:DUF1778 domain-containing protein [Halomonas sp. OfavH-34-E]MCO7217980.1 DUF1778 domain-containing protein [Halomonas sp. OfavH-34-E]
MSDTNGVREERVPLNLRVERRRLNLIDRAVAEVGGDRTGFIVDAACRRAEDLLLDRCLFRADEEAFAALDRALEPTAESNEALAALMRRERCWPE